MESRKRKRKAQVAGVEWDTGGVYREEKTVQVEYDVDWIFFIYMYTSLGTAGFLRVRVTELSEINGVLRNVTMYINMYSVSELFSNLSLQVERQDGHPSV